MTPQLDQLLTVDEVVSRYRLRDRRTARALMHEIGAIRIGRRLFVQSADVARYEAAHRDAPGSARSSEPGSPAGARTPPRRTAKPTTPLPAGWWRQRPTE